MKSSIRHCGRARRAGGLALALSVAVPFCVRAATFYVWSDSPAESAPYDTWENASRDLRNAVEYANTNAGADTIVVTNGTHAVSAQITISETLTIESVNGPEATVVQGNGSTRIFWAAADGVVLDGLWIRDGYGSAGQKGGGGLFIDVGVGNACVARNCFFTHNYAPESHTGDGAAVQGWSGRGELRNCVVAGNLAGRYAAVETHRSEATLVLVHCTVTRNRSLKDGGGVYEQGGAIYVTNSIVYDNIAVDRYPNYGPGNNITFAYTCADPAPPGNGNLSTNPVFAKGGVLYGLQHTMGDYRLGPGSSLGDAGLSLPDIAADLEGTARPQGSGCAMGAFEPPATGAGPLRASFSADRTAGHRPQQIVYTIEAVDGADTSNLQYEWRFGDGNSSSGSALTSATNTYTSAGDYVAALVLRNGSSEVTTNYCRTAVRIINPDVYVSSAGSATPPYGTWETAAHTIPDALEAADVEGAYTSLVHVADGSYQPLSGSFEFDRGVIVRSVNGPDRAFLEGNGSTVVRINNSAEGLVLDGFTVTNGSAWDAGGIDCRSSATIQNCRILGNQATEDGGGVAAKGEGAFTATLRNCLIAGNQCGRRGGGIETEAGTVTRLLIENCTVTRNACTGARPSPDGGGISRWGAAVEVRSSIVYGNTVPAGEPGTNYYGSAVSFDYSCTFPEPGAGAANIATDPLFLDPGTGHGLALVYGDYTLQDASPCIDAGNNAWAALPLDLAGNPRILQGTVDIGAYEWLRRPYGTLLMVY